MRIRPRTFFVAFVAIEIAIGMWIFFAPTKLGGSSTYAVTAGVSMQPLLYKNDLAIVRTQSAYHVGDVVLYNSAVLGKPVLHRIILIQNGQYYFKGDNNNFVDPGYATRSELVGKLWVHVPDLGAAVDWFGQPFHAALLAGFASMFVVLAGGKPRRRRRRRRHHDFAALPPSSPTRTEEQPWLRKEERLDTKAAPRAEIGGQAHR
jgi:signal peptidase I